MKTRVKRAVKRALRKLIKDHGVKAVDFWLEWMEKNEVKIVIKQVEVSKIFDYHVVKFTVEADYSNLMTYYFTVNFFTKYYGIKEFENRGDLKGNIFITYYTKGVFSDVERLIGLHLEEVKRYRKKFIYKEKIRLTGESLRKKVEEFLDLEKEPPILTTEDAITLTRDYLIGEDFAFDMEELENVVREIYCSEEYQTKLWRIVREFAEKYLKGS